MAVIVPDPRWIAEEERERIATSLRVESRVGTLAAVCHELENSIAVHAPVGVDRARVRTEVALVWLTIEVPTNRWKRLRWLLRVVRCLWRAPALRR